MRKHLKDHEGSKEAHVDQRERADLPLLCFVYNFSIYYIFKAFSNTLFFYFLHFIFIKKIF